MTDEQAALICALNQCSLPPRTSKKSFIQSMGRMPKDAELTPKQVEYLNLLRHHFRRQFKEPCPCCTKQGD